MFAIFFQGLLLGYGASVPLDPINVLIMNYALHSYKKALAMGFGAMSADITYLILIVFGFVRLVEGDWFFRFVSLFGGLFLLYLSYAIYQGRNRMIENKPLKNENLLQIHLKGYSLTLLNPYTVGFWVSMTSLCITGIYEIRGLSGKTRMGRKKRCIEHPFFVCFEKKTSKKIVRRFVESGMLSGYLNFVLSGFTNCSVSVAPAHLL